FASPVRLIGMSFRLVIPRRVALQQSSPPLTQPPLVCSKFRRLSRLTQPTATVPFQRVSQKGSLHLARLNKTELNGTQFQITDRSWQARGWTGPVRASHARR